MIKFKEHPGLLTTFYKIQRSLFMSLCLAGLPNARLFLLSLLKRLLDGSDSQLPALTCSKVQISNKQP